MKKTVIVLSFGVLAGWLGAGPVRVSEKFGFDAVDATENLQKAFDSGEREILVDNVGAPWIVRSLFARSNQRIVFEKGVELLAKSGEYKGRNDRMLTIRDVDNVEIVGNGAVLRMRREDYIGPAYSHGEWRHALAINGGHGITVDGLVLENSGGDGIYISEGGGMNQPGGRLAKDVVIRNCVCDRNHRQGLSIISGENILVEKCVFRNTKGVPPEDGVDIEPNDANGHCVNIVVRDCVSENNAGIGFETALSHLRASTRPVSVLYENCRSTGDRYGVKIRTCVDPKKADYPTGKVVHRGCVFERTLSEAINVQQVPKTAFETVFDDCTFAKIGTATPDAPLIVLFTMFDGDPKPALPTMKDMKWSDRGGRRLYAYDTLDFSVHGEEALAVQTVDPASACVTDSRQGEFAKVEPVAIRHRARYHVYADCAREIRLAAKQVRVGPPSRKATKGKVDVLSAAGEKVATFDLPGFEGAEMKFAAPAAGFYSLDFKIGSHAIAVTGADVPVALETTAYADKRGRRHELNAFKACGSFFVPIKAGARAEFRMQGSSPGERVGVEIVDPDGKTAFANESLLYAEHYLTTPATKDGIWELRLRMPKIGHPEDSSFELAGVPPLFFLFKDRYW